VKESVITSRANPLVKSIGGLTDKKNRIKEEAFRFDGIKLFCEAVDFGMDIKNVIIKVPEKESVKEAVEKAVSSGRLDERCVVRVGESVFEKLSEERAPEGIITVASFVPSLHCRENFQKAADIASGHKKILILESVRDPGNLGAIMRSCNALGIELLVISSDCADIYSPKAIRSAMGAVFKQKTLTVPVEELAEFITALRTSGRRVYATALSDRSLSIDDIKLGESDCFVIGNEGHGLSEGVIESCDAPVIIPMVEGAESLNAAVAASLCVWETVRIKKV
jgi:TrmH family RNA methyltransferase